MEEKGNIYKTDNLALAPYLDMEGLKYIGRYSEVIKGKIAKIFFCFEDPKNIGNELALSFTDSREGTYRKKYAFFRNEIEEEKNKVNQRG